MLDVYGLPRQRMGSYPPRRYMRAGSAEGLHCILIPNADRGRTRAKRVIVRN